MVVVDRCRHRTQPHFAGPRINRSRTSPGAIAVLLSRAGGPRLLAGGGDARNFRRTGNHLPPVGSQRSKLACSSGEWPISADRPRDLRFYRRTCCRGRELAGRCRARPRREILRKKAFLSLRRCRPPPPDLPPFCSALRRPPPKSGALPPLAPQPRTSAP